MKSGIMSEGEQRLGGLDYCKMLAALLVIAIHTSPLSSFSSDADFLFTRVLARVAVPFFLMVTGYFLLPQYLFEKSADKKPLFVFLKKTAALYGIAVVLYLPVNFYAGHFQNIDLRSTLRMLLFDGTLYHLWYLPAAILGVLLLFIISRKLPFPAILGITIFLYGYGLLGDSYYGFLGKESFLKGLYDGMFELFSYTRNGIFYAPIFLTMGAYLHGNPQTKTSHLPKKFFSLIGAAVSLTLMITEGFLLHGLNVQRHDSMYITLPALLFFLFSILLSTRIHPVKSLRRISTSIYLIHPLVIILVRGAAKFTHTEKLLVDQSLLHYLAVCVLSCGFGVMVEWFLNRKNRRPFSTGRAWIELNKTNLRQNILALSSLLPAGAKLMPVLKANAYGHGAVLLGKELNRLGLRSFCVATVQEGAELRQNGIQGEILVLGYTHPESLFLLKKYHLTQTVLDCAYAQTLAAYGKKLSVQIKLDTGMHRLGERAENMDEIRSIFRCENLTVTGMYSHLCTADATSELAVQFTHDQAKAFYQALSDLKASGYPCGKTHLLASYGLLRYPELSGDYARVGISLYGVLSSRTDLNNCPIPLYPLLSIKARVALIRDLHKGESAGYGLQYVAVKNRKIAVLSIGYADGIPRTLSCGRGKVLLCEQEAPIIGRICMDQMLVDITEIPDVQPSDIATIIGKSGQYEITAYDLTEASDTITNELLSRLSNRLERVML